MDLHELFADYNIGVMATSGADGSVNTAVYARPRVIDDSTLVWGMTEGRTLNNLLENPKASFLFRRSGHGFSGVRLALELIRKEDSGEMLEAIKTGTAQVVGPGAGLAVKYAVWFRITGHRDLI